jgi:gliding motility-associated-like protein
VNNSTGAGNLSYQWLINGQVVSSSSTPNLSYTLPGNIPFGQLSDNFVLTMVAVDSNNCTDTVSQNITVSIPHAQPTYSFAGAILNTNGVYNCPPLFGSYVDSSQSIGNISAWNWQFGNGNNASILENPSNTFVNNGVFDLYFEITDEYGCTDDTTVNDYVAIGGPEGNPLVYQNGTICSQGAGFLVQSPMNLDSLIWDMGDGNFVYNQTNFFYNYDSVGSYVPSVTLISIDGCEIEILLDTVTVQDDGLDANFTANPMLVDQNDPVLFDDLSTFISSPIVSWTWDLGNDSTYTLGNDANQTATYALSGPYTITLTVIDAQGCEDTYTLVINVKDPDLIIPNVITPNGDGTNDFFILSEAYFKTYNVLIFNRWGNVVYNLENQTGTALWDGKTLNGTACTDGVYFYRITGEMLGGTLVDRTSFVTVIGSE